MIDPVQMLIDAGAIPSTPFAPVSRYFGVPLAVLPSSGDQPGIVYLRRRFMPRIDASNIGARHVVSAVDRYDTISARYLGDPLAYWRIADANAVVDPNELTDALGRRVDIPLFSGP